jgi:hypothetical protein
MYAGGHSEMEELNALQQRLQFDDPINIQFTSVRRFLYDLCMQCRKSVFQARDIAENRV